MHFKSEESRKNSLEMLKRGWKAQTKKSAKIREEYYKNPKLCKNCKIVIIFDKKRNDFCSKSCSAKYNNLGKIRNVRGINGRYCKEENKVNFLVYNTIKKDYFCAYCGKLLNHNKKYCNRNCQAMNSMQIAKDIIESGENVSSSALRKYLMRKYDNKCQKCGWGIPNPTSNTVCLDMHHIDGDYKNNKLSNVEILCPNCHSITDNYKRVQHNRKSTRINRKT